MKIFSKLSLAIVLLATSLGSPAHHSFAMFDHAKELTLAGEVRAFQWTNPHIWIHVAVTDEAGTTLEWKIEGGSPNTMQRRGWSRKSLAAGDRVSIVVHPAKDGTPFGNLKSAVLADGSRVGD